MHYIITIVNIIKQLPVAFPYHIQIVINIYSCPAIFTHMKYCI